MGSKYSPNQLIFIDESSKDERTLSRHYGYSLRNTHAVEKTVFVRGKRYTMLPALSLDGIIALDIMEGSCDKQRFNKFIMDKVVCRVRCILLLIVIDSLLSLQLPQMRPYPEKHSVIVLDNAQIHHNADWIDMVKNAGGHVEFLPPYSPDFNPIELAFSSIKAFLKRYNELIEMQEDNEYCLAIACAQISAEKATQFFKHCMYL